MMQLRAIVADERDEEQARTLHAFHTHFVDGAGDE